MAIKGCKYCGKKINRNLEFCCNECKNKYDKIVEGDNLKIKYFIVGVIVGFLIMLYGVCSENDFMIGIGIVLMGMTVILLPFTTPETTAFFGYQRAKVIGRTLGVLLTIVGIWVSYF